MDYNGSRDYSVAAYGRRSGRLGRRVGVYQVVTQAELCGYQLNQIFVNMDKLVDQRFSLHSYGFPARSTWRSCLPWTTANLGLQFSRLS